MKHNVLGGINIGAEKAVFNLVMRVQFKAAGLQFFAVGAESVRVHTATGIIKFHRIVGHIRRTGQKDVLPFRPREIRAPV